MRCTCPQNEVPHHHAFGGSYTCQGLPDCRRCSEYEDRVWGDAPLPPASRATFKAARQRRHHPTTREH